MPQSTKQNKIIGAGPPPVPILVTLHLRQNPRADLNPIKTTTPTAVPKTEHLLSPLIHPALQKPDDLNGEAPHKPQIPVTSRIDHATGPHRVSQFRHAEVSEVDCVHRHGVRGAGVETREGGRRDPDLYWGGCEVAVSYGR
jgi:hypothetical protein